MTYKTTAKVQQIQIEYLPYITGWFGNFIVNNDNHRKSEVKKIN